MPDGDELKIVSSAPLPDLSIAKSEPLPSATPGAFQRGPGQPVEQAVKPQAPPTGMERLAEITTGSRHPWDDTVEEWNRFKADPTGRLLELGKETAMVIPNMASAVLHPLKTAQTITGSPQLAEDIKNKNVRGAVGDVAGGMINLGIMGAGAKEAEPATASEKLSAQTQSAISKVTKATTKTDVEAGKAALDFQNAVPPTKSTPYTPADYKSARPYLEVEHQGSPITTVEQVRDSADSAISKIEDKVGQYIRANPQDRITSQPLNDVAQTLQKNARGQSFVSAGMKELQDFQLDQPKTVQQADDIRQQLNAENKAVLKKNNYDVDTARKADPGFAAREAAAESLRNGIYDKLEERQISGVRELRQDEGSLIKIRNAAQGQVLGGEKMVAGTGQNGPIRAISKGLVKAGATGAGAAIAGPAGAIAGNVVGEMGTKLIGSENLTRDQLAARSFTRSVTKAPVYPEIPAAPKVAGLLGPGAIEAPMSSGTEPAAGTTQKLPYIVVQGKGGQMTKQFLMKDPGVSQISSGGKLYKIYRQ